MTTEDTTALFPPFEAPEDLVRRAAEKGWPDDYVQRMVNLRWPREGIDWHLARDASGLKNTGYEVELDERLTFGTIRGRLAGGGDNDALVELFATSPEDIGDWQVTVERGPDAVAQFRLQENSWIRLIEDRKLILAVMQHSWRNSLVCGQKLTVTCTMAWRVRQEFRGSNLSRATRMIGHPHRPPAHGDYWYIRSGNFGVVHVINAHDRAILAAAPEQEGDVPGLPVTVSAYPAQKAKHHPGLRPATRDDVPACVELINRTHAGLDLFRPYTPEFLERKLDEWGWGEKPVWWQPVYTWNDYCVLEERGKIVACGGLWDRGKNVRERWRHTKTGDEKVLSATALLDFGFVPGHEDAMAALVRYFVGRTLEVGRDHLLAPLDQLPELAARLEDLHPTNETRGLNWRTLALAGGGQTPVPDPAITRPYTDLAYW